LLCYPYTDTGNAERLVHLFGAQIRYCPEMKKWIVWDFKRWVPDTSGKARRLAKITVRNFYAQAAGIDDEKAREAAEGFARHSESAGSIRAMLECAQYEDGIAICAKELDSDPWLLNCLDGTIDLRTGEIRAHSPKDFITKLCAIHFDREARCDLFKQFLARIMADRTELIEYLQRAFGYALTGIVTEKAVFVLVGDGDNGKTTLLELFRFMLGDYAAQVLIDTLMLRQENNASLSDLADLRGARFVTTSETEEGQKLWEGKLKYLTGMNEIKTCRKYENHMTFPATHKFFLDANHRPVVRGTDKAIWNRLKPIPFRVSIPKEEQDKGLLDRLKAEAAAILAWAVEGCLAWQRLGLAEPEEVQGANQEWQAESDPLQDFIADSAELRPDAFCTSQDLRISYESWAAENGVHALPSNKFADRLKHLGCLSVRDKTTRGWKGIGLKVS